MFELRWVATQNAGLECLINEFVVSDIMFGMTSPSDLAASSPEIHEPASKEFFIKLKEETA